VRAASDRTIDAATRRQGHKARGSECTPTTAGNVRDRDFEATAPNRKWIADFNNVWTVEGWLYVAAVVDLFSRRIIADVFDYMERFCNLKRRHSTIGYLSPIEFDQKSVLA